MKPSWTLSACVALALVACVGDERDPLRCRGCNIVLIVIDTLRADHLPCYGYARNTAPVICGLASGSLLFEDVVATSSWTKPSVASLLSGLYAKTHGALSEGESLSDDITILPEILSAQGYATHAFSGNGSVGPDWNFDQGYDSFRQFGDPTNHIRSDAVNEEALPFVDSIEDGPFFLFVHYVDPHDPYTPSASMRTFSKGRRVPTRKKFEAFVAGYPRTKPPLAAQIDFYDDEILENDRSVGKLLGALKERGVLDETVVVITSDHGEEFFEHGAFTHRKQLYEESVRVPLLIRIPGLRSGVRIAETVSLVDVLPTLLDIVGIDAPAPLEGISWFEIERHSGFVYAEHRDFGRELYSLRNRSAKVIYHTRPTERVEFFDLTADPGERDSAEESVELVTRLKRWVAADRRPTTPSVPTPEQTAILRKLGYVE